MFWGRTWLYGQVLLPLLFVVDGYRLNVPRVLLPYHPEIQVGFELVVTDPEGGCFQWRSTRNDVVSVKVPTGRGGCSDRAQIFATSKHASEQTAMVFAEDRNAGVVLSCGVAVDVIKSIVISTTTKVLFLDAGPSHMVIQALNSEGDMFSNLGGIPFEWELLSDTSKRPLRIVPFAQSKYEAPDGVRMLEESRKRGYVVLVEGVQTGTASLKAELSESFFQDVSSHEIVLVVVANLLLVPSSDLYLPIGASVRYSAQIVKQGATEPISLPSKQYQLEIADSAICSLNDDFSRVTALSLGTTELSLIDRNVKANLALKPPSVHIHVVEPSSVSFSISGDSWYLEVGRQYTISVQVFDVRDNMLYISDNSVFETKVPKDSFKILKESANQTYFEVEAVKSGVARLKSKFLSIRMPDGTDYKLVSVLAGEQTVTISDPVMVNPTLVLFPYYNERSRHSLKVKASGGTGVYIWASEDAAVARVDASGVVTSERVGETRITVKDARNNIHGAKAVVRVLAPAKITFAETAFEAEVGGTLKLGITVFAEWSGKLIPLTSCDQLPFTSTVSDPSIFEVVEGSGKQSGSESTCATVLLRALSSGDATVTVSLGKASAVTYISSYNPLKLKQTEQIVLSPGSETEITYLGGPRPWILDRSKHFAKFEYSDSVKLLHHSYSNGRLLVACNDAIGDILVRVHVGNHKTPTNPLPALSVAELRVCCAVPSRLELGIERLSSEDTTFCPTTSQSIHAKEKSKLYARAFGLCSSGPMAGVERLFDSISGLVVQWDVDDSKLLQIEEAPNETACDKSFVTVVPQGSPGLCTVTAKCEKFTVMGKKKTLPSKLSASLDLPLLEHARADPMEVVIWNERTTRKKIRIIAGSGHFNVVQSFDRTVVDVAVNKGSVEVTPLRTGRTTVQFLDLCFGNRFEAVVTVTDLDQISIAASKYLEINGEIPLTVKALGAEGVIFTEEDVAAMNVNIDSTSDVLSVVRVDPLHYRLLGNSVGTTALKASARSAEGEIIYSSLHEVQVFAPLILLPKVVTLIPDAVFQFEIIGGPQPNPAVSFTMNDTSIATVNSVGLISSKKLGYTSVTGSLDIERTASKDSAVVKVVSLAGVRIVASGLTLDRSGRAWVRVEGLSDDETPFSFCGALYPLHITWSLGSHGILEMTSPLGTTVSEGLDNQFQVFLKALSPGQADIRVSVTIHPAAQKYTAKSSRFKDHLTITVIDSLELTQPPLRPTSMITSPDSNIELKSNRANGSIEFAVPSQFKRIISISGGDHPVLTSHGIGEAVIAVRDHSTPLNRTTFVPVSVVAPHSIFLDLITTIPLSEDGRVLPSLPLGFHISLRSRIQDYTGRLLHSSNAKTRFRPHRFDLTEVVPTDASHTVDVYLKEAGETTLKVWDERNPALNSFLRLPVASVITPAVTSILLSDITCFKSALPSARWSELSSRKHFNMLDASAGISLARELGDAVIAASFPDNQTTFAKLNVLEPDGMWFGDAPALVSNIHGHQYIFPVFLRSSTVSSNVHGCDLRDMERFDGLKAPFDCSVSFSKESSVPAQKMFTARAVFSSISNSYACVLEEMPIDASRSPVESVKGDIIVKASFNQFGKPLLAEVKTEFYPRFEVEQQELRLDNVHALDGAVTIYAPESSASSIAIDSCNEDVLRISKTKSDAVNTIRHKVKLNVNSVLLWRELLQDCNLTIRNTLTGQVEEVPVKIALHGDAAKALKHATESILYQLYEKTTSYLTVLGTLLATAIAATFILAWCKGYSIFPYLFAPVYKPQPGVAGVFASDRISAAPGYVSPVRYMRQTQSPAFSNVDRYQAALTHSPDFSLNGSSRYSSHNRSVGSSGDSFLWSKDALKSSPSFRDKVL